MEIINCCKAFIIGVFFTLIIFFTGVIIKDKNSINKVKFFVKAMGDEKYHLYIEDKNENFMFISTHVDFNSFGLDIKDFADMKEGQLREVYLNLEN